MRTAVLMVLALLPAATATHEDPVERVVQAFTDYVEGLNASDSPQEIANKTLVFAQDAGLICYTDRQSFATFEDAVANWGMPIEIDPNAHTLTTRTVEPEREGWSVVQHIISFDPNHLGCAVWEPLAAAPDCPPDAPDHCKEVMKRLSDLVRLS